MNVIKLDGNMQNLTQVDLGNDRLSEIVTELVQLLSGKEAFLVEWEGSRVPIGAIVNDQEIGWTQHGIVTSVTGQNIGYYQRLIDDLSEPKQVMLIFVG